MSTNKSFRLNQSDRQQLKGWPDIQRPEPEQILPLITQDPEPKKETSAQRLKPIRDRASEIVDKISKLQQAVDDRCSRFKVFSDQGRGSPLFQAMFRVFGEKTTTVTYDHYKRALQYRQQLADEDSERLRQT
jgi:hypothetical protein